MKNKSYSYESKDDVIKAAITFINEPLESRYNDETKSFTCPDHARNFLQLHHKQTPHETFSVVFLDSKNKNIAFETLFAGSIAQASVYPRTIAQRVLYHNASNVILCHHHPSLDTTPSESDKVLTQRIIKTLNLVDTKVLDHFILGGTKSFSMAEHQMM